MNQLNLGFQLLQGVSQLSRVCLSYQFELKESLDFKETLASRLSNHLRIFSSTAIETFSVVLDALSIAFCVCPKLS